MNKAEKVMFCAIVIILFYFGGIPYINAIMGNMKKQETVSRYTEIYSAVCPFGIFMSEGGGAFVFGCGGFSVSTEETYIIKYFDRENALKSVSLEAEDSTIIIDGTMRLEIIEWHYVTYRNHEVMSSEPMDHWAHRDSYVIHLPFLPSPAYNITDEFIFGGP